MVGETEGVREEGRCELVVPAFDKRQLQGSGEQ